MRAARIGLLLAIAACSREAPAPRSEPASAAPTGRLVGVYPERFQCDSVATSEQLTEALGGAVRPLDSSMPTPRGVPRPCNYVLQVGAGVDGGAPAVEAWTFDIDCRDNALETADALFAQYRQTSAALVESYAAAKEAGKNLTADGGPPAKAPEAARDVEGVGARALDHHGQGLLFVDDDAPCYVRVVGPDAARRLALATLVAQNLTLERAPMTPRAAPAK
jgi:hypothetical protein